jgi:Hint domain
MAAVRIPAGTFGDHGALAVSPQHRLHFTGWRAELYCGEAEVLVKAIHLVRAGRLQQDASGAPVTYHHLLFDRHQIICAEGVWSESYHPGPVTLGEDDPDMRDEILALFPELAVTLDAYGPTARPEAPGHAVAFLCA